MGQARLTNSDNSASWPKDLQDKAKAALLKDTTTYQPVVISMSSSRAESKLAELLNQLPIIRVTDNYDEQLAELYLSKNSQLYKANDSVKAHSIKGYLEEHYRDTPAWKKGSWVYYPWNGELVHVLEEELFWQLRTIRNSYLVTETEQAAYRNFNVGCAGLSVGSNGAAAIALTSGSQRLKICDGAVLSGSNLNRLRAGVSSVGLQKSVVIARQLFELNPYLEVMARQQNLDGKTLENFFTLPWQLNVIVDEIDELEMKVRIRMMAKKHRIPVVMVTEPGDDLMLDVERYDLNPRLPIFHGLAGNIEEVMQKGRLSQREFVKYATMIIGVKNLSLRAQKAMLKVGSTIPSPPQLGSTAMMAGGLIAYAIRQLATGAPLKSGRHFISLDNILLDGTKGLRSRYRHIKHSQALVKALKRM